MSSSSSAAARNGLIDRECRCLSAAVIGRGSDHRTTHESYFCPKLQRWKRAPVSCDSFNVTTLWTLCLAAAWALWERQICPRKKGAAFKLVFKLFPPSHGLSSALASCSARIRWFRSIFVARGAYQASELLADRSMAGVQNSAFARARFYAQRSRTNTRRPH